MRHFGVKTLLVIDVQCLSRNRNKSQKGDQSNNFTVTEIGKNSTPSQLPRDVTTPQRCPKDIVCTRNMSLGLSSGM